MTADAPRFTEQQVLAFAADLFERLGLTAEAALQSARSLVDASLLGIDSHGIESLDMYARHLLAGGMDAFAAPTCLHEHGGLSLWDMSNGPGLSGARALMSHAIDRAREHGVAALACRRTNHFGACAVYALMAAERGVIGLAGMQTRAMFAPQGGAQKRVGQSPLALAAPVEGLFPFCFDASLASMTNARMKRLQRRGEPLPPGIALDESGRPTTDPEKAWFGQVLPIGGHKGAGLAMALEILHCVLSGNIHSDQVPSAVVNPDQAGGTSLFMLVLSPALVIGERNFAADVRRYVDNIESSPPLPGGPGPHYPGRGMGERRQDRLRHGIPIPCEALDRLNGLARSVSLPELRD